MTIRSEPISKVERLLLLRVFQNEVLALNPIIGSPISDDLELRYARLRVVVRTVHSVIEATLAMMASEVLRGEERGLLVLNDKDREMARIQSGIVDPDAPDQKKRKKFSKKARAILRSYGELHGGLDTEGRKAMQMPEQIANWTPLRHRITHPQQLADFTISHGDKKACAAIMEWYQRLANWVFEVERKNSAVSYSTQLQLLKDIQSLDLSKSEDQGRFDDLKKKLVQALG